MMFFMTSRLLQLRLSLLMLYTTKSQVLYLVERNDILLFGFMSKIKL